MAEYEQEHLGEFVYDTYEQEGPIPVQLVGPAKERIVRCRDCMSVCEHYEGMKVYWCDYLRMYVGSNDFCAWGNRRDDG